MAVRHRMPVKAAFREFPLTGSLMSYGPNLPFIYRRASAFVDKILKGHATERDSGRAAREV